MTDLIIPRISVAPLNATAIVFYIARPNLCFCLAAIIQHVYIPSGLMTEGIYVIIITST